MSTQQSLFSKRLIFSLIFSILQSALIKKAEDTEADTAEQSAIKLRAQQQSSNALVLTDQRPVNGTPTSSQLTLVKVPNMSSYPVCFFVFSLNCQNFIIQFFLMLEPVDGSLLLDMVF